MAALTLYELNSMVRDVVELGMPGSYWVEAELSEVRELSGHCYMELVQKDLTGNSTVRAPRPVAGGRRGLLCARASNRLRASISVQG